MLPCVRFLHFKWPFPQSPSSVDLFERVIMLELFMDHNTTQCPIYSIKYGFILALKSAFDRGNFQGGRPSKFTDEVVGKLRTAFMMGCNDTTACYSAEISRDTLYAWRKKYPWFSDKIDAWKRHPIMKAEATIYKHLDEVPTAKWYLERRAKSEYGLRQRVVINNTNTVSKVLDKIEKDNSLRY